MTEISFLASVTLLGTEATPEWKGNLLGVGRFGVPERIMWIMLSFTKVLRTTFALLDWLYGRRMRAYSSQSDNLFSKPFV
jgi:hypothetical protein